MAKKPLKCNQPVRTPNHPTKSHMVKACEGGKEKLLKFGSADYRHNYSAPANENFRARMRCDTDPASKLEPRYWACESLWARRKKRQS